MSKSSFSRIPGFYRLPIEERRRLLLDASNLTDLVSLDHGGIDILTADGMIENVVGTFALPLGIALNFHVNNRDVLVPMVVEEPSVIAAASNAARMVREGGGFVVDVDASIMIGQVQLCDVLDPLAAKANILAHKDDILARAQRVVPRLCERSGGPVDLNVRILSAPSDPDGGMLVVHIDVDCLDAMGANMVNTIAEAVADRLAELCGDNTRVGLRILSNLAEKRLVRATATVPTHALVRDGQDGQGVCDAIVSASRFAELDPYRATTHNKGIMNGIDAVLLATANDWRAVEAGAHAYACQGGKYRPLATWKKKGADLIGRLEMPLAIATVGGPQRVHDGAKLALALLAIDSAKELAATVAAAGLATNLAALRALATEGIQRGHMSLHARVVARSVGATGATLDQVAAEIVKLGDIRPERARDILARVERLGPINAPTLEIAK